MPYPIKPILQMARCPDGSILTRVSRHRYTHVVICTDRQLLPGQPAWHSWRWAGTQQLAERFQRAMQAKADAGYGQMAGLTFQTVPVLSVHETAELLLQQGAR